MFSRVVLPHPLGPTTVKNSPSSTSRSTPSSATTRSLVNGLTYSCLSPRIVIFAVTSLGAYRKISTRFCRLLGCNTQVLKKNKRVLANSFIVFIDRTPVFWFTAHLGFANSGQNGTQDLFPKDHQRCDGADSLWWNRVSPGIGH